MSAGHRAAIVLSSLLLAGCTTGPGDSDPVEGSSPEPDAIEMAAVGDSITEADSPDYAAGELGEASWVAHAVGEDVSFAGGWAKWGATTAEMAAAVEPVEADVLVMLAGTNDLGLGEDFDVTAANLEEIVEIVGAERTILSAVPPIDSAPSSAIALNEQLQDLATEQGWQWVDAPAGVREGDRFGEGMASDGLHPTSRGAAIIGEAVHDAVIEP